MLPGYTNILECGKCGKLMRQNTLRSGNTFGASFYTDGYVKAPMLPEYPVFSRCPNCGDFFWVNDLKVVDSLDPLFDTKKSLSKELSAKLQSGEIPFVAFLNIDESFDFLDSGKITDKTRERIIRIYIWQEYNHKLRGLYVDPDNKKSIDETRTSMLTESPDDHLRWKNNLLRLLELLEEDMTDSHLDDREKSSSMLMAAEINRNLGNFETALSYLDQVSGENYKNYKDVITSLCKQKRRYVSGV